MFLLFILSLELKIDTIWQDVFEFKIQKFWIVLDFVPTEDSCKIGRWIIYLVHLQNFPKN